VPGESLDGLCNVCGEEREYCIKHDETFCSEVDGCGWCDAEKQREYELRQKLGLEEE
jgi:ribosomal protein L37E